MDPQVLVVYCTCPNEVVAREISRAITTKKLAACVNIIPKVESIYIWNGQSETDEEVLCIIKTTTEKYQSMEDEIIKLHPYEICEIIDIPVIKGHSAYLNWVKENT